MRFAPAPEYKVFPQLGERPLKPYQAAVAGAEATQPLIEEFDPDAVVVDILTVAGVAGRRGRGPALGHAGPARAAHHRARAPAVLDRGPASPHPAGRPAVGAAPAAAAAAARTRAGASSTARASGSACRRSTTRTAASPASWR